VRIGLLACLMLAVAGLCAGVFLGHGATKRRPYQVVQGLDAVGYGQWHHASGAEIRQYWRRFNRLRAEMTKQGDGGTEPTLFFQAGPCNLQGVAMVSTAVAPGPGMISTAVAEPACSFFAKPFR
jgi:hypothetical protein